MPQVPLYGGGGPTVEQEGAQVPKQSISPPAEAFGANVIGAAISDVGKVAEQHGEILAKQVDFNQALKNKADSDTAYYNMSQQVNGLTNTLEGLRGHAVQDALPQFYQDLDKLHQQTRAQLTNPVAQSYFDSDARKMLGYTMSGASRYAAGEGRKANLAASQGALEGAASLIPSRIGDPSALQDSLLKMRAASDHTMALLGETDPGAMDRAYRKNAGPELAKAVELVAADDPYKAKALLEKVGPDHMEAGLYMTELKKLEKTIQPIEDAKIGKQIGEAQLQGVGDPVGPKFTTDPKDIANFYDNVLIPKLEHGHPGDVNKFSGASGSAQITPDTYADMRKNHGDLNLPAFDQATDADKHKAGFARFGDMVKLADGNLVVASAMYNAGPAVVQAWINGNKQSYHSSHYGGMQEANPNGIKLGLPATPEETAAWVKQIPWSETRKYATTALANSSSTNIQAADRLPQAQAAAEAAAEKIAPNDPIRQQNIVAVAMKRVKTQASLEVGAAATAQQSLLTILNGGDDGRQPKPSSIDELFQQHPEAAKMYASLDGGAQQNIRNTLKGNLNEKQGDMEKDPKHIALVSVQKFQAQNTPKAFIAQYPNPNVFLDSSKYSPAEQAALTGLWLKASNGTNTPNPHLSAALSDPLVKSAVNTMWPDANARQSDEGYKTFLAAANSRLMDAASRAPKGQLSTKERQDEMSALLANYNTKAETSVTGGTHGFDQVPKVWADRYTNWRASQGLPAQSKQELVGDYFRTHRLTGSSRMGAGQ